MKRIPSPVLAGLLLVAISLALQHGIAPLTEFLTGTPAPLPSSLHGMYVLMAALAILLYLSVQEDRWRGFQLPLFAFLRGDADLPPTGRWGRRLFLVGFPLWGAWWGFDAASTQADPPADPPGIHFNLPTAYLNVQNPLPWSEENIREGGVIYTQNCAVCHGDAQDGNGPFARAWQPKPANFRDSGTIAQLDENYLFWRIKEGAPGLPHGTIRYRSTMPVWDGVLTDDQIWKVIMFEYTNAGVEPAKRSE